MTVTVDRTEPDLVPDLSDPTAGRVAQPGAAVVERRHVPEVQADVAVREAGQEVAAVDERAALGHPPRAAVVVP